MSVDQLKELKRLQKENEQLRRAVSDLTLDKLILKKAARGNFYAPFVVVLALIMCVASSKSRNQSDAINLSRPRHSIQKRDTFAQSGIRL